MIRELVLTCWLLCFVAMHAVAQHYTISHQHFSVGDGLSSPGVNQVTKDHRGFLWVATKSGLDRFDGNRFVPYFQNQITHEVIAVITDYNNIIWVIENPHGKKDDYTVKAFDPENESLRELSEFYPSAKGIDFSELTYNMKTNDGIYFGGYGDRMICFKEGVFEVREGLGDGFHAPVTWSKEHGVFTFSKFNNRGPLGSLYHINRLDTICLDSTTLGNVVERGCLGVSKDGHLRYTGGYQQDLDLTDRILEYRPDQTLTVPISISQLVEDSVTRFSDLMFKHNPHNDETWLIHNNLLYIYDQDYKLLYSGDISDDFTFSQKLRKIYFENENVAWFCSVRGLVRVSTSELRFKRLFTSNITGPLRKWGSNSCRQIHEAGSKILLATDNGIVEMNHSGDFNYLTGEHQVSYGFHYENENIIYTEDHNLLIQNLSTRKVEKLVDQPFTFHANPWMVEMNSDSMVITTGPTLIIADLPKDSTTEFKLWQENGYSLGQVYQKVYKEGIHYLATDAGLFSIDLSTRLISSFAKENGGSIPSNNVHSILPYHNGFWLSTADAGLIQWNMQTDSINTYDRSDGLPSDVVYGVLEDDNGYLWISTDNGLSKYNPNSKAFKNYGIKDGLPEFEFNRTSFHKGASGNLYFGTVDGFIKFNPQHFVDDSLTNDVPLQVIALSQDISDSSKVVDTYADFLQNQNVVLGPFDRFFIIAFKLLDYDQHRHTYAYKLDGLDTEWQNLDQNSIRIGGLDGGEYTLRVKGQLDNGTWSINELRIPVTVLIPFYKELWFLLLSALFILSSVILIVRWRTSRLRTRAFELESTVAERTTELDRSLRQKEILLKEIHHRVKNNLQIISSFIELETMGIEDEKTKQVLKQGRNRVKAMALIHKNLYQKGDLGHIQMQEYCQELLTSIMNGFEGTSNRVCLNIDTNGIDLDIDTAIPLGLILTELVTNSFKYAFSGQSKGNIDITLAGTDEKYVLIMKDDGHGFPEKSERRKGSLGLRLVDMLSDQLDGTVKYENDNGAKITIDFLGIEARKNED